MTIGSYPTVYAVGHKAISDIFSGDVVVEEKVDGSQFSFGFIDDELQCRSKGKQLILDAPEKMFMKAVNTARELQSKLHPEWIYRCEYLQSPKHNTLAYDRVPNQNLILFDVMIGFEEYASPEDKVKIADELGLELAPILYVGKVDTFEMFQSFLEMTSILGGCKVEGVVIKNYSIFTMEKKIAIGKYVSEQFKEVHGGEWRKSNPTSTDIIQELINKYKTPARWMKAIQHLKERGELEGSPRDIGKLIKEIPTDTQKECEDEIKEALFKYAWPKISRGITSGMPEWYKQELAKSAFGDEL